MVHALLILDRLPFLASKDSIQLIAPDKATKQSRDLKCVYVFIHNTSKSRLNKISRLKEPQHVYYSAGKIPNSLHNIH